MKHEESNLQIACVNWFRLAYPQYAGLLFSVPNGGKRSVVTATIMKREGALAGVADLFLAARSLRYIHCRGLWIEMKAGTKWKQSDSQKEFEKNVTAQSYRYELVDNFDRFKELIDDYLK